MIKFYNPALADTAIDRSSENKEGLEKHRELIQDGRIIPIMKIQGEKNAKKVLVVEPHSDDGIYSAGGLLSKLFSEGSMIISVCVFSKHETLEIVRKREAERIYKDIFGGNVIFLNFLDGFFRTGNGIADSYMADYVAVKQALSECIKREEPDIVLGPLAIGGHIDHKLVHSALIAYCKKNKKFKMWFYEDYPYCNQNRIQFFKKISNLASQGRLHSKYVEISEFLYNKVSLNMVYRSQHSETWEKLYENYSELAKMVGSEAKMLEKTCEEGWYERYWVLE